MRWQPHWLAAWIAALFASAPLAASAQNTATLQLMNFVWQSLGQRFHSDADTAYVEVRDIDRDLDPAATDSVTATISSLTDSSETMWLYESGPNTGRFRGVIPIELLPGCAHCQPGPPFAATDGRLQVRAADWVTVQHHDPSGGFGIPRDLSDEALFVGPNEFGWVSPDRIEGTWTQSMSPIVITADIQIAESTQLVIEAGVEVLFLAGCSIGVLGDLEVAGAPGDSVRFSSVERTPAPGDWGPLAVGWGGGQAIANIHFAILEFGTGCRGGEGPLNLWNCALRFHADAAAVWDQGLGPGSPSLRDCVIEWNKGFGLSYIGGRHCTIRNNGLGGIQGDARIDSCLVVDNDGPAIDGGYVTVFYSTVVGNRGGITITEGSNGIQHNEIHDNGDEYDLINESVQEIDARYNDWGPITTAEMNAGGNPKDITRIQDFYDNPADGFVNYSEWVTSVAVLITDTRAELTQAGVCLQWSVGDAEGLQAELQRRTHATAWSTHAILGPLSDNALVFEDTNVVPGERYGYRLVVDADGSPYVGGEVWIELPGAKLAIHGITPNPGTATSVVTFSLTERAPAKLVLYDVRGRVVSTTALRSIGPGTHALPLAPGAVIPHGVYFAVLSQGRQSAAARFVLGR